MELERQKNTATIIIFPIVDDDGDLVSGATGLDSEICKWSDGFMPGGFVDCTNEAVEVGSSGIYSLSLTQAEMNADYAVIQIKTATPSAKPQIIIIRTMIGDPLNYATTEDGRQIDVEAGGTVGLDFANVNDATSAHTLVNITVPTVTGVSQLGTQAKADVKAEVDDSINSAIPTMADAVWDESISEHIASNSIGRLLVQLLQTEFTQRSITKATMAVPEQGITSAMVTSGCIQYETVKVSLTRDFSNPDFTFYVLWHYDADHDVDIKKPSLTTT